MDKLKGRAGKQVYFKLTNYFLDTKILKRCSWTSAKQTQEKPKKVFLDRLRTSWKHCNTTNHHFIRYTCSTPGQQTMSERSHSPKHGGSQVTVLDSQSGRSIHRSILIQSHYWDVGEVADGSILNVRLKNLQQLNAYSLRWPKPQSNVLGTCMKGVSRTRLDEKKKKI